MRGIKIASQKMLATFGILGDLWQPLAELNVCKYIIYIKNTKDRHESMTRGKLIQNILRPPKLIRDLSEITANQACQSMAFMLQKNGQDNCTSHAKHLNSFLGENGMAKSRLCLFFANVGILENVKLL